MIKLKDLISEGSGQVYEYGCAMLYFNFPEINKVHDMINPDHIYTEEGDRTYGLEDEPHTTLLFGLHPEVSVKDVQDVLNKYAYSPCKIHNASLFKNPQYDVLKFDVEGESLHESNADLKEYPHTNNFPDYHPHLTIGYLKPGTGEKYVKALKGVEFTLTPQHAVYSKPSGEQVEMKIKVN